MTATSVMSLPRTWHYALSEDWPVHHPGFCKYCADCQAWLKARQP